MKQTLNNSQFSNANSLYSTFKTAAKLAAKPKINAALSNIFFVQDSWIITNGHVLIKFWNNIYIEGLDKKSRDKGVVLDLQDFLAALKETPIQNGQTYKFIWDKSEGVFKLNNINIKRVDAPVPNFKYAIGWMENLDCREPDFSDQFRKGNMNPFNPELLYQLMAVFNLMECGDDYSENLTCVTGPLLDCQDEVSNEHKLFFHAQDRLGAVIGCIR